MKFGKNRYFLSYYEFFAKKKKNVFFLKKFIKKTSEFLKKTTNYQISCRKFQEDFFPILYLRICPSKFLHSHKISLYDQQNQKDLFLPSEQDPFPRGKDPSQVAAP